MLQINNTIISLDVLEKNFVCDLKKCKGACCVHGDSGAPLEEGEKEKLEEIYHKVEPYLRKESVKAFQEQGVSVIDSDGDQVTPLINGEECAFTIFENDIAKCSIEKAFFDKKVDFRKPISCQLYPIRTKMLTDLEALNYHRWHICDVALEKGKKENVKVYEFLKEPLIRKYGKAWYKEL